MLIWFLRMRGGPPSAGNRQPWRFIIIEEANTREAIGEIYQEIRKEEMKDLPPESPYFNTVSEKILKPITTRRSLYPECWSCVLC